MIYVCSDIHGMYDTFIQLLEEINFTQEDELYILGDIIDRGLESYKVYEYVKSQDHIHLLKGNHEQMLIDYVKRRDPNWFLNGGYKTLTSIPYHDHDELDNYLKEMKAYFEGLPLYFIKEVAGKKYVMVHAGVDYRYPIDQQKASDLLWIREGFLDLDIEYSDGVVIYGHTPNRTMRFNQSGSDDIVMDKYKIGLDGAAYFGGQLNCLRLDDLKAFSVKVK